MVLRCSAEARAPCALCDRARLGRHDLRRLGGVVALDDRLLLNVTLPATQRAYEVCVSLDLIVCEATEVMVRMIDEVTHGLFLPTGHERLMLLDGEDKGSLLDPHARLGVLAQDVLVDGIRVALV